MKERKTIDYLLFALFAVTCCALVIVGSGRTEEAPDVRIENVREYGLKPFCLSSLNGKNSPEEKEPQIPFELLRNKIILPIRVNNSRELKIILDTGMPSQGLLLFDRDLAEELKLTGTKRYRVQGAGKGQVSYALMVESSKLSLSGVDFENQRVLILQSDTMRGTPTDGAIGNTIFDFYTVKVDYDKKIITLLNPSSFEPDPTWEIISLTFNENRIPFLDASISVAGDKEIDVSLYIDLASSEALELLVKKEMKFPLPVNLKSKYLGKGLDGHILGQYGRVAGLKIGSFVLHDVPTAFPKSEVRSRQRGADGILCNNALRRFNLIFDYSRGKLYIKPNSHFSESFNQN